MATRKKVQFRVGGVYVCETDMYRAHFKCIKRTKCFVWLEPSAMWKRHMHRTEPLKLKCKWISLEGFNGRIYDMEYVVYKDGYLIFDADNETGEENFHA